MFPFIMLYMMSHKIPFIMTIISPTLLLRQGIVDSNSVKMTMCSFTGQLLMLILKSMPDKIRQVLLHIKIAELYVIVRGFSSTSGLLEQYKQ